MLKTWRTLITNLRVFIAGILFKLMRTFITETLDRLRSWTHTKNTCIAANHFEDSIETLNVGYVK